MNKRNKRLSAIAIVLATLGAILSGCGGIQMKPTIKLPEPPSNVRHADRQTDYRQSPTLENMLPMMAPDMPSTVAERLPLEPLTVPTNGTYSGHMKLFREDYYNSQIASWRAKTEDGNQAIPLSVEQSNFLPSVQNMLWEPVVMENDDLIIGNIFQQWQVEDDGKRHLITLREGLCWSDGSLVTAYDIKFALDVWSADEVFSPEPGKVLEPRRSKVWALHGDIYGNLPTIEIIDSFSCRITCAAADLGLPLRAALAENGYLDLLMPSAYLAKFHIDYTHYKTVWLEMRKIELLPYPNELAKEAARQRGDPEPENPDPDESWAVLFWKMLDCRMGNDSYRYPAWAAQIPTLTPWMLPASFEGNKQLEREAPLDGIIKPSLSLIRNPFYFKVDQAGQQLPYYDILDFQFNDGQWDVAISTPLMIGVDDYRAVLMNPNIFRNTPFLERAHACPRYSPRLAQTLRGEEWLTSDKNPIAQVIGQWETVPDVYTGYALGLAFHYQHPDPQYQAAINDPAFRVALSAAIDRNRIISEIFNHHAQSPAWIPNQAELPQQYSGMQIPILLQLQNCLPFEEYEKLLSIVAENLQSIGLNARIMNEAESTAYHHDVPGALAPVLTFTLVPSEHSPTPSAQFLPAGWANQTSEEAQAFTVQIQALYTASAEEMKNAWQAVGAQIGALQPYIPLVDQIESFLYKTPSLQGNDGKTLLEQYRSISLWWNSD